MEPVDSLSDTIVARATPPGEGAISIVRLSGRDACVVGAKVAPTRSRPDSHRLVVAGLRSAAGDLLDEGMKVEMHAPHSFTGEDVVELHVHGSRVVVDSVVQACVDHGARMARGGEFSMRAFVNGRLDLAQAEAVADLISARSDVQQLIATAQLRGGLSEAVGGLLDNLARVRADWQAVLDFPEQLEDVDVPDHVETLTETSCKIQLMTDNARVELSRGLRVVLCGAPNAGKSTLLNTWAGRERVLVDQAPGTTRDPVEVELRDGGVRWSLCDTAGVRQDATAVEARGIQMSREWIESADLALWLVAADQPMWPPDDLEVELVGSKTDLADQRIAQEIEAECTRRGLALWGWVSAHTGEGVAELRDQIRARWETSTREGEAVVVRQRHLDALRSALAAVERARAPVALDLRCMEVEEASRHLGAIVGRDVDMEVLDRIFSEFCIGK